MSALDFLSDAARAELEELINKMVTARIEALAPTSESSEYLTILEAAQFLRCQRQRIDDLLSSGRLTRHKEGRRTLVARDELAKHVRRCDART